MAITSILKLYCNCFLLSEGLLAILLPGRLASWLRMCVCAFKVPRCNDIVPSLAQVLSCNCAHELYSPQLSHGYPPTITNI
ncbi:hypothetical protein C8J57DRAFT_1373030 [Mycena rebaudengoi]|nr:hypothetical protein C8J57DRAFT_1373030 [Mycena rebaudengoi]